MCVSVSVSLRFLFLCCFLIAAGLQSSLLVISPEVLPGLASMVSLLEPRTELYAGAGGGLPTWARGFMAVRTLGVHRCRSQRPRTLQLSGLMPRRGADPGAYTIIHAP